MEDEVQKAEQDVKNAWPVVMKWVGGITALIGLFASVYGGVSWLANHHRQHAESQAKLALAQAQAKEGEYQAAVQSYEDVLKADPLYRPALDQQLNTTMLWVENFNVLVREDQNAADLAAPALDQIMAILDAGLTRAKGTQAADIQAHIGWAHWLNQKIAEREFGPAAERNFRAALAADPTNVYANAMLGNWLLQTDGNFAEAIQHLNTAVATDKQRPFVRVFQIGGLIDLDRKGARAELMRAANDMRKSGESLDEDHKKRILDTCFDPIITHHGELEECLTAVPSDDAWATYLWLGDNPEFSDGQPPVRDFVYANLLELTGKRQQALERYRTLQGELKNSPGGLKDRVDAALVRLSHS